MNISGFLAIGNGEKCPYCELIVLEQTDTLKHMIYNHPKELEAVLFGWEFEGEE